MLQVNQHFRLPGHNFNKHAKFTLIEELSDTRIDKELLKYRLKKKREEFWIIKLKTLQPHRFSISCASVSLTIICRRDIKKHNVTISNNWHQICNLISPLKTNTISREDSPRLKLVETNSAFLLV